MALSDTDPTTSSPRTREAFDRVPHADGTKAGSRVPAEQELIAAIRVPADQELIAAIRDVEKLHAISGKILSSREVRDCLEAMGHRVGKKRVARFRGTSAPVVFGNGSGKENAVGSAEKADPWGRIANWLGMNVVINRQVLLHHLRNAVTLRLINPHAGPARDTKDHGAHAHADHRAGRVAGLVRNHGHRGVDSLFGAAEIPGLARGLVQGIRVARDGGPFLALLALTERPLPSRYAIDVTYQAYPPLVADQAYPALIRAICTVRHI